MKYTLEKNLEVTDYQTIVEVVRLSEQTRNFDEAIAVFKTVWDDFETDPDFSAFQPPQQAQLFRLSGYFLSNYGRKYNRKNFQERGKDLLTISIKIYESLDDFENIAEAQNALAICYYFEGAVLEAEAILEQTAKDFLSNQLHLLYLQNRGNLLLAKLSQKKYQEALSIIEEIEIPMEFCEDKRTCSVFHEKAGMVYRGIKQFDKAISHYHRAIKYAEEINNDVFISSAKNNLAFLFNKLRDFETAHFHADEAIRIALENHQSGWLPHYFDTKAMIFANEGFFELALEIIEKAIIEFKKGDGVAGLTEAIWNKCKFLLHLNRKEEAILLFNDLIPMAAQQMGEFAVKNLVKDFANLIHIKQNGSLDEEVSRFKRTEIVNAILEAKYNLHEAAEALKINPTVLTKTLDKEFPELYNELNLIHQPKSEQDFEIVNTNPTVPRNISELKMDHSKFKFENEAPRKIKTFYFSADKMLDAFGIEQDSVVAILPIYKISVDQFILIEDLSRNLYSFGRVNYDQDLDLYYLVEKDEPMPISLNEVKLIGEAFAFCPFDKIDDDQLHFRSLNF